MTFAEIVTEVQKALARSDADVTDRIAEWVNRRQRSAVARHSFGFTFTETTVAIAANPGSQQSYALPTDFKDEVMFMLHKTDGYVELPIRSLVDMRRSFGPSDPGQPEFVTLEPGVGYFRLWPPIPNDDFTVRILYYQWPADLSGAQTNWLTDRFPQLLIAGAVADGFWFIGAPEDAAFWEQRFEVVFRQAKVSDVGRLMPTPAVLEPRLDVMTPGLTPRRRDGWPF